MLSIKAVNALSHYTDWTIAHVHTGALGWNGFMSFGMIYWLIPRLWNRPLAYPKLPTTHFWLATIGIVLYIVSMWAAGLTEGLSGGRWTRRASSSTRASWTSCTSCSHSTGSGWRAA